MRSLKNKIKDFSKNKLRLAMPFITKEGLNMFGYKLVKNDEFDELEWNSQRIVDISERAKNYILKGDKDMAMAYMETIIGHANCIDITVKGHS